MYYLKMDHRKLHSWNVSPEKAILIQEELVKQMSLTNKPGKINIVAGCDVAYSSTGKAYAVICIFSYPGLEKLDELVAESEVTFPYIPGLLAFREGPPLLKAFGAVNKKPDVVIFNGQGIAHPRKMGLATHMGILLDLPSIGCAQKSMFRDYADPDNNKCAYSEIRDTVNEVIGVCLRTRKNVKPVFVSSGYKIDLETAVNVICKFTLRYKMPEPLRAAHIVANAIKKP